MIKQVSSWEESASGEFAKEELRILAEATVETLTVKFLASDPIVLLRALYELMAHDRIDTAVEVMRNEKLQKKLESVFVSTFSPDGLMLYAIVPTLLEKGIALN